MKPNRLCCLLEIFLFFCLALRPVDARLVRIAYPGISIGAMVPALALEKKFFEQEGLQVELISIASNRGIAAMIGGDIDYSTASSTGLRAGLQGLPVKILMFYVRRPYHAIVGQKDMKSIQDLRGKIVATSGPVGAAYYIPRAILEHNGLNPDRDVKLISVGGGDITERLLQLERQHFDATVLSPPLLFIAEDKGYPILGTAADFLELPQQGITATKQKLESNPEEVKKVLGIFLRTLRFVQERKKETVDFMRRWLKIDERVADKSYQMVLQSFSWNGEVGPKAVEESISLAKKEAKITREVPPNELLDFGLLREVRARAP